MKLTVAPFLVLSLGILAATAQRENPSSPKGNHNVCRSKDCARSAKMLLQNMNLAVDPCEDFHEFACGKYFKRTKIPKDRGSVGGLSEATEFSDRIVHRILTSDPKSLKGSKGFPLNDISRRNLAKVQADYNSCMNESKLKSIGRKPLYEDLRQLVTEIYPVRNSLLTGAFPGAKVSPKTPTLNAIDRDRLTSALIQFTKAGIDSLEIMEAYYDLMNPAYQQIYISEGTLGLPNAVMYKDDKVRKVYQKHLEEMFTLFIGPTKGNKSKVNVRKIAQHVLALETKIANISKDGDSGDYYNIQTAKQLNKLNPAIDWARYLQATIGTDKASVTSLAYQQQLGQILSGESDVTLQAFFAWKMILARSGALSSDYRRPIEIFQAIAKGEPDAETPPLRSYTCTEVANKDLGMVIGHFYLSVAFSPEAKKEGEEIIDALLNTYRVELGKVEWLDTQTRKKAIEKLDAITELVAYSRFNPDVSSSKQLEEYYRPLDIKGDDFYGNQKRANLFRMAEALAKAGKRTDKRRMEDVPHQVNAFYQPLSNQIVFPAGILQKPMFAAHDPEYLNFGGMGIIAGHEITHGFDNNGRDYGPDGRAINWWTDATSAHFEEKAQCFVNEYNRFTVKGSEGKSLHVNGTLTLGENISDNGGLKMAYSAWASRFASDPKGKRFNNQLLPGLEKFSREQLFFIGYSQTWCVKATPAYMEYLVKNDEHSPARARVNGSVQNSKAFAKAFKCKPKTKMNPAKKCELW